MRNAERPTAATPPTSQELAVPGRETAARKTGRGWREFHLAIRKALAPAFTALDRAPNPRAGRREAVTQRRAAENRRPTKNRFSVKSAT